MTLDDTAPSRRSLLGMAGAAMIASSGMLQAQGATEPEVVKLWPGRPPNTPAQQNIAYVEKRPGPKGLRAIHGIAEPVMTVCRPAKPNGTAMLVMPGGGYGVEMIDGEGMLPAEVLNRQGITAFVLTYRLPGEGWDRQADVPLQDAQRAMRLIRSNAARYGVAPDRLGVLGFSAGGHLAGSLATRFDEKVYTLSDPAEQVSARPDLAAMLYPVVTMSPPLTHMGSHDALLGKDAPEAMCRHCSVDQRVSAATPPVFLAQASDDKVVPVENSILMYHAMFAQHRQVAMHLFESGGHGFGTGLPPSAPAAVWPSLMLAFAASHGFAVS